MLKQAERRSNMKTISIVVPCYNEEESLPIFYKEVEKIVSTMPVKIEYIFVNDGSKDQTVEILRRLAKQDSTFFIIF